MWQWILHLQKLSSIHSKILKHILSLFHNISQKNLASIFQRAQEPKLQNWYWSYSKTLFLLRIKCYRPTVHTFTKHSGSEVDLHYCEHLYQLYWAFSRKVLKGQCRTMIFILVLFTLRVECYTLSERNTQKSLSTCITQSFTWNHTHSCISSRNTQVVGKEAFCFCIVVAL